MSDSNAQDKLRVARLDSRGRKVILERLEKPSTQAGKGHLERRDQLAQASAMMMERLFSGASLQTLQDKFGVSEGTVKRRLEMARQDGVPDEARRVFIQEMLPTAMAVVQEALLSEDEKIRTQAAWKVIDGLRAMELIGHADGPPAQGEESLEFWRARFTRPAPLAPSNPASDAEGRGDVVEGAVVRTQDSRSESSSEGHQALPGPDGDSRRVEIGSEDPEGSED